MSGGGGTQYSLVHQGAELAQHDIIKCYICAISEMVLFLFENSNSTNQHAINFTILLFYNLFAISALCYFYYTISSPSPYLEISLTHDQKQRAISAIVLFHPLTPTQKQCISSLTHDQKQRAISAIVLSSLTPTQKQRANSVILFHP